MPWHAPEACHRSAVRRRPTLTRASPPRGRVGSRVGHLQAPLRRCSTPRRGTRSSSRSARHQTQPAEHHQAQHGVEPLTLLVLAVLLDKFRLRDHFLLRGPRSLRTCSRTAPQPLPMKSRVRRSSQIPPICRCLKDFDERATRTRTRIFMGKMLDAIVFPAVIMTITIAAEPHREQEEAILLVTVPRGLDPVAALPRERALGPTPSRRVSVTSS